MNFDLHTHTHTPAVCYLSIFTWAGKSGEHWYGRLSSGQDHNGVEVKAMLTTDEADRLNEYDDSFTYKAGDNSSRFFSKEALLIAAVNCWQSHFPKAHLLIEGHYNTLEPQPVLAGPAHIKDQINALWRRCEELDWDYEACKELCARWRRIWKEEIEPLVGF